MSATGQSAGARPASTSAVLAELFRELYRQSGAAAFAIPEDAFARLLADIGCKYLPVGASDAEAGAFYRTLRLEELALARACAAGSEAAWEVFLIRYREKLYDVARAITGEDSSARELADSLYAELYGTKERAGKRVSKLEYYNGRGSLEGWLRVTLAQERVNAVRRARREVSLEEKTEVGQQFASPEPPAQSCPDPRLAQAADQALASLGAEDRYILAAYYLDGFTLAQIARFLGVHESTISRKIHKIAAGLRNNILRELVQRGMTRRQAEEALEVDVGDLTLDVRARLTQEKQKIAFSDKGSKE